MASSMGMRTLAQTVVTANTVIGNPLLTFTSVEKLYCVFDPASDPPRVLGQRTIDELRNQPQGIDPPMNYAIYATGASTVTIKLSSTPATIYALGADAEAIIATLSGSQSPAFPQSYHDALIYAACEVEADKMEKYDFGAKMGAMFAKRTSDLRFFIQKSAYLRQWAAKNSSASMSAPLVTP